MTRAASFAVMATALAAAGHHLISAATLAASTCLMAVLGLFAAALPRAGRRGSLTNDLSAMAAAQAATCWWFGHLGDVPTSAPSSAHDGPWGLSYLALTLAVGWTLHTADTACSRLGNAVQGELGSLAVRLRALFVPWITPTGSLDPRPFVGSRSSRTGAPPYEALLADAVVRRGPPRRRRLRLPDASPVVKP
ncbi:hypothetical protein [Streptomyces sp. NPDC059979]|uniref:hypothetical protein n=1 Tax=Streptomyces sp. NPDC059979 TaxID=3347021 RepID=UPI003691AD6E